VPATSGGTRLLSKSCRRKAEQDRSRTPDLRGATMYDKPVEPKAPRTFTERIF
jgi:hypothetical protein